MTGPEDSPVILNTPLKKRKSKTQRKQYTQHTQYTQLNPYAQNEPSHVTIKHNKQNIKQTNQLIIQLIIK